ncbi:MAG: energy transducer TonB, partial [Armatimonadota bacterium]|nr:energy transducer TonB [Armatimonadota bacterium]
TVPPASTTVAAAALRPPVSSRPAPSPVLRRPAPLPSTAGSAPTRPEPGGALNLGSASERGELEGLPTGQTPVGWVPGADEGKGAGSGSGEGVGTPEPSVPAVPAAPPPPRRVRLRVCAETRLLPNPYCPQVVTIEVDEGSEPRQTCAKHQPPRTVKVRVCAESRLLPNPYCPRVTTLEVLEGSEPKTICTLHKAPPPVVAAAPPPPPAPAAPRAVEVPVRPARLVHVVKPRYPEAARNDEHQGAVSLQVVVRPDGTCGEVTVTRSSGSRVLDAAAVRAVQQWRWEPARRGDEPVESTFACRVRFELED